MKNNLFIKSTIILIIGGFITKLLGFIIRIIYTRIVGEEAISLYTLITPTYSLVVSIAAGFLPIAISKIVAENKYSNKNLIINSLFLITLIDLVFMILLFFTSRYISFTLLKEKRTLYILYSVIITIPFISFSSIFKGYYLGKQKMHPNVVSNIIEQIIRIILIILLIPYLKKINIVLSVVGLIMISIITELISCLIFISFLPKFKLKHKDLKISKKIINDILSISIPFVLSRLIGNIGYFFEPILLTNILLKKGYSKNYILKNYGAYNAYSISLLAMPNFFIMAISSAILPEISKNYSKNNISLVRRRFKQALIFAFILGVFFSTIIVAFRKQLLLIIYKTTSGSDFIKILGPIFVLYYLEGILTSTLQAIGKAKDTFKITTIGIIIKLSIMSIFSCFKYGIYSLILAEIVNIIIVVLLSSIRVKRKLF